VTAALLELHRPRCFGDMALFPIANTLFTYHCHHAGCHVCNLCRGKIKLLIVGHILADFFKLQICLAKPNEHQPRFRPDLISKITSWGQIVVVVVVIEKNVIIKVTN